MSSVLEMSTIRGMAGSKVRPAQYKSLRRMSANEKSHSCAVAVYDSCWVVRDRVNPVLDFRCDAGTDRAVLQESYLGAWSLHLRGCRGAGCGDPGASVRRHPLVNR